MRKILLIVCLSLFAVACEEKPDPYWTTIHSTGIATVAVIDWYHREITMLYDNGKILVFKPCFYDAIPVWQGFRGEILYTHHSSGGAEYCKKIIEAKQLVGAR